MKPFFVLMGAFVISLVVIKLSAGFWNMWLSGNIAMSAMLCFTAIGHFAFTRGMAMMLPPFMPFKKQLIYLTGLIEVAAAIGLMVLSLRVLTSYLLIIFLALLLPSNIYAAAKKVNYEKANTSGAGLEYLWFRIPFQLLLMAWIYIFNIYPTVNLF